MTKTITVVLSLIMFSCNINKKLNEKETSNLQNIDLLTLTESQNNFMEALTFGILTLSSEGCLKVGDKTIIWPYGYKLGTDKNVICNAEGDIVVKVGDQIQLSGGECSNCSKEQIKKLTGNLPNDKCYGDYWIVGNEIIVK